MNSDSGTTLQSLTSYFSLPVNETIRDVNYDVKKKEKVLDQLKRDKFSSLKGSNLLIDKIQKQRESAQLKNTNKLLDKQQDILRKLNRENVNLIELNLKYEHELKKSEEVVKSLTKTNEELIEQNDNLKDQLATSQAYSIRLLKELKNSRHQSFVAKKST